MKTFLKAGNGFDVGQNFARAAVDTEITLAPDEVGVRYCVGYIKPDPSSSLGFLRHGEACGPFAGMVRVHALKSAIGYEPSEPSEQDPDETDEEDFRDGCPNT